MNKDIVLLDLFSGIGGFSKGLSDAGFNITKHYFSEIDKHAIAVYKYQFKNSEYVGSVVDLDGRSITRPNIITFGSPCQDFSVAGKRAGMDGQRSSLIGQALRLITECRPDVFIWENVKGVFSSNNGADFWAIIQAFANIGGYRVEWQLLNTAWVLPQNRERIYLIGHLAETGGRFIFPFRENSNQDDVIQGQRTNTNTIKARYEANGDGSYIIENKLNAQINITGHSGSGGYHGNVYGDGLMSCLTGTDYKQPKQISCVAQRGRGENNEQQLEPRKDDNTNSLTGVQKDNLILVTEHEDKFRFYRDDKKKSGVQGMDIFKESAKVIDIIDNHPKNIQVCDYRGDEGLRIREDGLSPTLQARAREDKWGMPMIIQSNTSLESGGKQPYQQNRIYEDSGIAPAIMKEKTDLLIANAVTPDAYLARGERNRDENGKAVLTSMHDRRIRRLTEIECERLQGFPDQHTAMGDYDGVIKPVAKTQRYKMCGNAVTVKIVEMIGKRLLDNNLEIS